MNSGMGMVKVGSKYLISKPISKMAAIFKAEALAIDSSIEKYLRKVNHKC